MSIIVVSNAFRLRLELLTLFWGPSPYEASVWSQPSREVNASPWPLFQHWRGQRAQMALAPAPAAPEADPTFPTPRPTANLDDLSEPGLYAIVALVLIEDRAADRCTPTAMHARARRLTRPSAPRADLHLRPVGAALHDPVGRAAPRADRLTRCRG